MPRRVGDNRAKDVADDLLKLFTIIDEENVFNVHSFLPSFVAFDLSRVPFLNVELFNQVSMMRKIENIEQRLNVMENGYIREAAAVPGDDMSTLTDRNGDGPLHAYGDDFPPLTHHMEAATTDASQELEDLQSDAGDDNDASGSTVNRRSRKQKQHLKYL